MKAYIMRVEQGVFRIVETPASIRGAVLIDIEPDEYQRLIEAQRQADWLSGRLLVMYVKGRDRGEKDVR